MDVVIIKLIFIGELVIFDIEHAKHPENYPSLKIMSYMKDNIGLSNKNAVALHNHFDFLRSKLIEYNLCENDVYHFFFF